MFEKTLKLNSNEEAVNIYGSVDKHLRYAEKEYQVKISARNHVLKIAGDKKRVEEAFRFFSTRLQDYRKSLEHTENGEKKSEEEGARSSFEGKVTFFHRGKAIRARSKNQEAYLEAIQRHDIVIGIGPAGTGKTYLAMASAIDALKKKKISKIVLTRPAVEAGESLGFLPGDLEDKIDPYLRPLYDALYDMVDYDEANRYLEKGIIEVAPLAYMRGRTLHKACVVMDEAQNSTHAQMKMILTRLGEDSKMIINGDITQVDLPRSQKSGLIEAKQILAKVSGLEFISFDESDVVRHPLVKKIITAYERYERKNDLL